LPPVVHDTFGAEAQDWKPEWLRHEPLPTFRSFPFTA
jgi:hypothetical protein